jgi:hypothetical protein
LLLAQGRNSRQYTLSKLAAHATLGPKAPLAPEHNGAENPFGGIIGKLHTLMVEKTPQRRLMLEQGATQRRTLGVLARRPFLQERADLHPELHGIDAERGALQRTIPYSVPPMEELRCTHAQGLPQSCSRTPCLRHLAELTNKVGPAQLVAFKRYPAIP